MVQESPKGQLFYARGSDAPHTCYRQDDGRWLVIANQVQRGTRVYQHYPDKLFHMAFYRDSDV